MGKATASMLKFEMDDALGVAVDLTQYIDDIGEHGVTTETEETTPFGTEWQTHGDVGVKGMSAFSIAGFFDDASPGPVTVIGDGSVGDTREVTITYKTGTTRTFDVVITNFNTIPQRNNKTRWSSQLQPTGSVGGIS